MIVQYINVGGKSMLGFQTREQARLVAREAKQEITTISPAIPRWLVAI